MSPIGGEAGACRAGWRSCFLIGLEAALQVPSAGPVLVVFMLPCVVAMVVPAARMWRAAAVPASRNLELAVVPAHARGLPWVPGRLPLRPLCAAGTLRAGCRGLDGGEDAEVLAQSGDVQPLVYLW